MGDEHVQRNDESSKIPSLEVGRNRHNTLVKRQTAGAPQSRPRRVDSGEAGKLRVRFVQSDDGYRLACYERGSGDAGTVIALHGFGSSALHTWGATQWLKLLAAVGIRVVAFDFRGHGKSGKPKTPDAYSLAAFERDAIVVAESLNIGQSAIIGYSMGARVGWELLRHNPSRFTHCVLGGMSKSRPLNRLDVNLARQLAHWNNGQNTDENNGEGRKNSMLKQYASLLNRKGNVLESLIALIEGMQQESDVNLMMPPRQPMLFSAGELDGLLPDTEELARAAGDSKMLVLPHRNHVNAPGSPVFKKAGIAFLQEH